MKINPNGFREYDARWLFEKDIDLEGIKDLGKGLGTQIIKFIKNKKTSSVTIAAEVNAIKPLSGESDQIKT